MNRNCYDYPCNTCIVKACCQHKCLEYYQFINHIADNLPTMTTAEIHEFRIKTPLNARKAAEQLWESKTRYIFPENIIDDLTKVRAGRLVR